MTFLLPNKKKKYRLFRIGQRQCGYGFSFPLGCLLCSMVAEVIYSQVIFLRFTLSLAGASLPIAEGVRYTRAKQC